jgi:hypothetical protein
MHRKRLVPVSGIAALAGVLVLCGCTSAATTTSTSPSPGVTTSTSGRPAGRQTPTYGGLGHITGYSDSDGSPQ